MINDFGSILVCSGCGAGNLHYHRAEVFERYGVKIFFDCEECDEVTVLEVIQHKGVTFLSQKSQKHRRSVIVPDKNPDITLWEAIQAAQRAWQASRGKD